MTLRQTIAFIENLTRLTGEGRIAPDVSMLSRCQKKLKVDILHWGLAGLLNPWIDSTGIKVEGGGEWNARKRSGRKRRVWWKIHIRIDEPTLAIWATEFMTSSMGNALMQPVLLNQIPPEQKIASVAANGAFDTHRCHDAIAARGAGAVISPRKNSRP